MSDQIKEFGDLAKGLARNPLGIIALFIVLWSKVSRAW
jgi:hypothetical protein